MKRSGVSWGTLAIVLSLPATGGVVYEETFDTDVGTFVIENAGSDPTAGWAFNDSCPPAASSPGTPPGTLRWGRFEDCTNYGIGAHHDFASTPDVDWPADCTLYFNDSLDFQEHVDFEVAEVDICFSTTCFQALHSKAGDFEDDGNWYAQSVGLPDGGGRARFGADSVDGNDNSGMGLLIDDVVIDCETLDPPPVGPGIVYWTDRLQGLFRADLDGSDTTLVASSGSTPSYGLALDLDGGFVYWSNGSFGPIRRAPLDGSGSVLDIPGTDGAHDA